MGIQNKIDVMVISSSRPKLLPYLMNSFDKYVHFQGKIRKIIHEDFVFPKWSKEVVEYAKENFHRVLKDKPKVGIGHSIANCLREIKTDYIFNLQDDWEFELPIDLNHILYVMDRNPHINCIYFNKRRNLNIINGYKFEEHEYDHLRLCKSNHWPMGPGIWRTQFVKDNWEVIEKGLTQEAFWNKKIEKSKNNESIYIYGPLQYPRVIRHLGYTWAMKPRGNKSVKRDGPGGTIKYDFSGQPAKMRAPWLPPEEERPLYLDNKKDQIKEWKEKEGKICKSEN